MPGQSMLEVKEMDIMTIVEVSIEMVWSGRME